MMSLCAGGFPAECCAKDDGGKCYLKRSFKNSPADFEDLSEVVEVEEDMK